MDLPRFSPERLRGYIAAVRHDGELRARCRWMKLAHCLTRTFPWLLGPAILDTFHVNPKRCPQRNERPIEQPRHFVASWRRKTSRGRNWRKHKMSAPARSI